MMHRALRLFTITLLLVGSTVNAAVNAADYRAIDKLGYAPEKAEQSVPELVGMLKSSEAQVRWRSARALGNLGAAAKSASPALVKLLADDDAVVQVHASVALGLIGDNSPATLEALIKKMTSEDERVARAALQTLRHLGAPPEKLAAALESVLETGDAVVMSHATETIISRGAEATPFLNAALAKEKSAYWAALAASEIGPDAAGAVPALIDLIRRDPEPMTLNEALIAVAKIGPSAVEAAGAVQEVAGTTEDNGTRIAACYALGSIGDPSSIELLTSLSGSGGPFQKMVCIWSLARLQPNDAEARDRAIQMLVKGLMSDRKEVREAAATGLYELEAPEGTAAPYLIAAVKTATPEQKSHIAMALASLGPQVLEPTIKALADPELRPVAIEVLGRLGPDAAEGVDGLIGVIKSDATDAVARAQYALAAIGAKAGPAADELAANLSHEAEEVRQSALFALRQLGSEAQQATQPLHEFLESSEDQFEKFATAWALTRMKLDTAVMRRVKATLEAALNSDDERVRLETVKAIRDLERASEVFKAKLADMAKNDPSADVRAAAAAVVE